MDASVISVFATGSRVQCIDLALSRPWVVFVDEKGLLQIWDRHSGCHVLTFDLDRVDDIRREDECEYDAARRTFMLPAAPMLAAPAKAQKVGRVRKVSFYDPVISECKFGSEFSSLRTEWVVVASSNRLVILELQLGLSAAARVLEFKPDVTEGRSVQTFEFYPNVGSRERPLVACGASDGDIRLLESFSRSVVTKLHGGHNKGVSSMAVLARVSGLPLLASASLDANVVVWDVQNGQSLHTLSNVCNGAPIQRLCLASSIQGAAVVYGFDGGILGDGGSIAMITGLTAEPRVSYCSKLAKPDKNLTCLTSFSHASLSHPLVALVAAEKDNTLNILRIDQPSLVPFPFLKLSEVPSHDQHSAVYAVASHPLIDGIVAVGTTSGVILATYDLLAAPQTFTVPHKSDSLEVVHTKGSVVWSSVVSRAQVMQSLQSSAPKQVFCRVPTESLTEAFVPACLKQRLIQRLSSHHSEAHEWVVVGDSQTWSLQCRGADAQWIDVTTESCTDVVFGPCAQGPSHTMYATLKPDHCITVKSISCNGAEPEVCCTRRVDCATRLFGGPYLCVSQEGECQFCAWSDLSTCSIPMPVPRLVHWASDGKFCALATQSCLHVLHVHDGVLKVIHSFPTQAMSLFWFFGTLFYTTPTEVLALVINSPEPMPIQLAQLTMKPNPVEQVLSHPSQHRPRGAVSIAGIVGEALLLLDVHAKLFAISLSHPFTKALIVASAGAGEQMLTLSRAVPSEHHDTLAYTLLQSCAGQATAALDLPGISAIMRMHLLVEMGRIDEATLEGEQAWSKGGIREDLSKLKQWKLGDSLEKLLISCIAHNRPFEPDLPPEDITRALRARLLQLCESGDSDGAQTFGVAFGHRYPEVTRHALALVVANTSSANKSNLWDLACMLRGAGLFSEAAIVARRTSKWSSEMSEFLAAWNESAGGKSGSLGAGFPMPEIQNLNFKPLQATVPTPPIKAQRPDPTNKNLPVASQVKSALAPLEQKPDEKPEEKKTSRLRTRKKKKKVESDDDGWE